MSDKMLSREGDRQAWFDLSCILGRGMEDLGWGVYNHLPEPRTKTGWHAVRYADRWDRFAHQHKDEALSALRHWFDSGQWPDLSGDAVYLLQLRFYVVIGCIENLYTGPGKYGETIIAFPRVATRELLCWWLMDWFESKGRDLLYREMSLRFWAKRKSVFSPEARRSAALPATPTWASPTYAPTVADPLIGKTVARLLTDVAADRASADTATPPIGMPVKEPFPPRIKDPWDPWVKRLLSLSQELARPDGCPYGLEASDKGFETFLRVLFEKEAEHRAESDAAVCYYIKNRSWPTQSPWAGYITFLRINCAADFACQLTAHDHSNLCLPFSDDDGEETILLWFLLDHWERCSDVWLKLTAVSMFYSLPFYGLTPAKE